MQFANIVKQYSIIFILLALNACVTIPETSIEYLQGPIPPDRGIVVAETINNSDRIVHWINNWEELILWRVDNNGEKDKKENNSRNPQAKNNKIYTFSLSAIKGAQSTQRFIGAIPEGTYRIGLLYTLKRHGDVTVSARALIPPALGTFEVKPGHVTNLGSILYHPIQLKSFTDIKMPDYAMSRIDNPSLWQDSKNYNTRISSHVQNHLPVLSWIADELDEMRTEVAKRMFGAGLVTDVYSVNDNKFVLTGVLGTLYEKKDDDWRKIDVGTRYKILSFTEFTDGRYLVGGEYGLLATASAPYTAWKHIQPPVTSAHVVDVGAHDELTYVTIYDGQHYNLYWFDIEKTSFTLAKTFPYNTRKEYEPGAKPHAVSVAEGLDVYFDSIRYRFDKQKKIWTETYTDNRYQDVLLQKNGALIAVPYSGGDATLHSSGSAIFPIAYSLDMGNSWKRAKSKYELHYLTQYRTYRTADGRLLRPGQDRVQQSLDLRQWTIFEETPFLESKDNGYTLKKVGALPERCNQIVNHISSDETLYVYCETGNLQKSSDLGRTWAPVYQNTALKLEDLPKELSVSIEILKALAEEARKLEEKSDIYE